MTSGQVFRWRNTEPGVWQGIDGENTYRAVLRGESLIVSSEADESDFRDLFALDQDTNQLKRNLIQADSRMEAVIERVPGIRLMRPSCPREALFSFLCASNCHITRITSMVHSLASLEGKPSFSSLKAIAETGEQRLRELGLGYRAKTIPEAAKEILTRGGENYLRALKSSDYCQVHQELAELPGVGPKLADCIALYAFHKTEAVPADTHLWQAAADLFFPENRGTRVTPRKHRELGDWFRDRFGSLAGYAQQYLFIDHLRPKKPL